MAVKKKYNAKYFRFTGIARYMKVYEPDEHPDTGAKNWKAPIYVDSKTKEKIKAAGIQLKFKEDDGSNPNTEAGEFITFKRPVEYNFPSGPTEFAPPTIYGADGKKIVWYEKDEDGDFIREGEPVLIGNGSKVEVTVEVYQTKRFGKGSRLVAVKILDLVEYTPSDNEGDDEPPFEQEQEAEPEVEVKAEPVKREKGKKISW